MYEKIANIVTTAISGFLKSVPGFWGWILRVVFGRVDDKIVEIGKQADVNVENKKEAKDKLGTFNEATNKPNVTHEEFTKAEDDFFNRP